MVMAAGTSPAGDGGQSSPAPGLPMETGVLGDPRFFRRDGPFGLDRLVQTAGGHVLRGEVAAGRLFSGVATLQAATADEVAVLHNPRYADAAGRTRAGVVIVAAGLAGRVSPGSAALVVPDPHVGWALVAGLFHPPARPVAGVHPSAVVDPAAQVDPSAEVGALAVIGAGAIVGPDCQIGPSAVIGTAVVMGPGCRVGAGASVSHAILGARVYVYPGARVGQEGFGFAITKTGFHSVPQLGRVILEDDVEIGSNSCVDRGASADTVIGAGSRIDNLIQIGHGVRLGKGCVMAAQGGISGSAVLGDFVQVGAQVGMAGHINVGSGARIGAQAGVMSDLAAGVSVVGSPALPIREFFRNVAVLRKLARRSGEAGSGREPAGGMAADSGEATG